jgi:hypothetical protein
MFLRVLDMFALFVAVFVACRFGDHVGYHSWYVMALILATNLIAYFRGLAAARG